MAGYDVHVKLTDALARPGSEVRVSYTRGGKKFSLVRPQCTSPRLSCQRAAE